MQLHLVENGKCVRIVGIHGEKTLEAKLRQLGLLPGDSATVLRQAPLGGPVMIEVDGRTIAVGRNIASRIEVEESECVSL
jgi:ferrous iron transport protein A